MFRLFFKYERPLLSMLYNFSSYLSISLYIVKATIRDFLISPFNINVIYFPALFLKNKSHGTFLAPLYPFMNYY
jgi:hypothetical protein